MKKAAVIYYSVRTKEYLDQDFCTAAVSVAAARKEASRMGLTAQVIKRTNVKKAKTCYGYSSFVRDGCQFEKGKTASWLGGVGTSGTEPPLCCM